MDQEKNIFDHLKAKDTFTPDASYFEQLADKVIEQKSSVTKIVPLYKKPMVWLVATAASIAFILMLNIPSSESSNVLLAFNEISTEEIQVYIEQNIDEFDTSLLTEYILPETLKQKKEINITPEIEYAITPNKTTDIDFETIEQDDILKYFEDEEIDIYDLDDFGLKDELNN
tara:strand:- start:1707 stop:2222 length:516 start_codon:yes stop_codon:yes gene_type:complete